MSEIIKKRERKRQRRDSVRDNFKFYDSVAEKVTKLCNGRVPLVLRAREYVRVGREISVMQLEASKIVVGLAPCRITPKLTKESGEKDKDGEEWAESVEDKPPQFEAQTTTEENATGQPSKRTIRLSEIVSQNVEAGVLRMMEAVRDRLLDSRENR